MLYQLNENFIILYKFITEIGCNLKLQKIHDLNKYLIINNYNIIIAIIVIAILLQIFKS